MLVFASSLRAESLNRRLAALAARAAERYGATVALASMRAFDVPLYDGDVETASGDPQGAQALRSRLLANDAFIMTSFYFIMTSSYEVASFRAYFEGCSTGGQQALSNAQRYPNDYDGILAVAPGNDRTHVASYFLWNHAALNAAPAAKLTQGAMVDGVASDIGKLCRQGWRGARRSRFGA